ncbi:MAG: Ppx/GppA family phosphatase [Nitrospirales bacterium]|nr:Ppx/GppA family phosphatase [Nitrospirales bacterium]
MIVAGIDIGTLTCRLLIAEVQADGSFRELEADRRLLRLGEGLDETGSLGLPAMTRVVEALSQWRGRISMRRAEATVVVATSAVRDAKNQREFLDRVKRETGFEVEVLSGTEEARRTLSGMKHGLLPQVDSLLGLDIGGGSTEFIRAFNDERLQVASLNIGVVRLSERCLHADPPEPQELASAERIIRQELESIRSIAVDATKATLVGTAGTITTLAAMAQRLSHYESARIHNYWLSLETVCQLQKELCARKAEERAQLPGLEPGREGVIVAGTVILRTVMGTFGFERCLVSDYGLREGIIVECAERLRR